MISIYTLQTKLIKGKIYLGYTNGVLTHIEYTGELLEHKSWLMLNEMLPQKEETIVWGVEQIDGVSNVGLTQRFIYKHLAPRTVKDKIILFCQSYKYFRNVSYQAKKTERANIKTVPVSEPLLRIFFESRLANFTIDNYIKRINITKDILTNGRNDKLFPNEPDMAFYRTLQGKEIQECTAFWRKNGWVKKHSPTSGTRFVKE